jgi:hypothetical protein
MRMMTTFVAASVIWAGTTLANAQSLTPMRGEVRSTSDVFALRVAPGNPYAGRMRVEVRVYDENFAPVAAQVQPPEMTIGANSTRNVLVLVPFEGQTERKVRVCAESIPFETQTTKLRTQVCGRFLARRAG